MHKDDILSVEKELYDLRVELATDAAGKFLEAETKLMEERRKADEEDLRKRQKAENDALEKSRKAKQDYYDKQKKDVEKYYDEIDRIESRRERDEELSDLKAEAAKYAGSATIEGQEHYKSLLDQIAGLEKEAAKEARTEERQAQVDEITAEAIKSEEEYAARSANLDAAHKKQDETLEKMYEKQESELQRQHNALITSAEQMAKGTVTALLNADQLLADGTLGIFDSFGVNLNSFITGSLEKVNVFAQALQTAFSRLDLAFGSIGSLGGSGVVNNNSTANTKTVTNSINNNGNVILRDKQDIQSYWGEQRAALAALSMRVR